MKRLMLVVILVFTSACTDDSSESEAPVIEDAEAQPGEQ